ncbi:hypothetical protein JI747_000050 [Chryseobacterium sp. RG1]|uniref:PH domain-containing protein n=1 Tax=Chryseobacterium tagetis TaxID=2801334 RepID=A0ABS7ZV10_9FLAO|nr:hypothetical protein [Chryseobacterium tagetis]MCA6065544.1 hypothetical protein [Chryseobacterium tagetis]
MANDYKTFHIYKPTKGFVWTRARVCYFLVIFSLLLMGFVLYVLKIPDQEIPKWFLWIVTPLLCIGGVGGFINKLFPEELKGKIEGKLIFENEKITVDNETFFIKDIKHLEISPNDYEGKKIYRNGFSGMFLQGCNNTLKIRIFNNQERKCFFQIRQPRELLQISNQLNHYIDNYGLLSKEARNHILNYN